MTEAGFLETLKRVEDVAVILTRMEDINVVLGKITTIEAFIDRFGTLEALIERFESVENQLYYLKDMLNIDEAAKYLNISKGHMYRLTSNRDISYTTNRMARTSSLKGRNWMNGNGAIQSFHKGNWKDRLL